MKSRTVTFKVIGNTPATPNQSAISANYNGLIFPCGTVEHPERAAQSIRWNVEAHVFNTAQGTFDERCEAAKSESGKVVNKFTEFIKSL